MRYGFLTVTVVAATSLGCGHVDVHSSSLPADAQQSITNGVRRFMDAVAQDVTHDGPSAWRKHFEDTPSFFMAVNGQLAFGDSRSATQGIQDAARAYKHIDLHWGDTVRVDPLTPNLAIVAAPYHEVLTTADNQQIISNGFFTGLAENHNGEWQFRDVHWSVPAPPANASASPGT